MTDRARAALLAAAVSSAAWQLRQFVPGEKAFHRTNHRGDTLTMWEGPAWTLGALAGLSTLPAAQRSAFLVAVGGAGLFGVVDDLTEKGQAKGLRGHLSALAHGEVTTGAVKILGISGAGAAAAWLLLRADGRPTPALVRAVDVLISGGVIAGSANLGNLLDLRPGRVLKLIALHSPSVLDDGALGAAQATALGAAAGVVAPDLGEQSMLGDCGANAAGALLGTNVVLATLGRRHGRWQRLGALAGLVGLTVASEKVSFTSVIESTPVLREIDALGRRPAGNP